MADPSARSGADGTSGRMTAAVTVHARRTAAATDALDHQADIAGVQAWCGQSSNATTKLYDRRHDRPEDSPTFEVAHGRRL